MRTPYLRTFSSANREPPSANSRNPQFTNPPKSLNPEDQEKSESDGRWNLRYQTE
jgi:hypothetical protein